MGALATDGALAGSGARALPAEGARAFPGDGAFAFTAEGLGAFAEGALAGGGASARSLHFLLHSLVSAFGHADSKEPCHRVRGVWPQFRCSCGTVRVIPCSGDLCCTCWLVLVILLRWLYLRGKTVMLTFCPASQWPGTLHPNR